MLLPDASFGRTGGAAAGGAAGGAVSGGLNAAYYGVNIADGMAKGAAYGAASGLILGGIKLAWAEMKYYTDLSSPTDVYDSTGTKMTAGTRPCVGCTSENQNWFTEMGMVKEGLDHNYMFGFKYSADSAFGHFINCVSKVHDFMNSWGYDAAGNYVAGSLSYNVAFQAWSLAGMVPAGMYTALALSAPYIQPAAAYMSTLNNKDKQGSI